MNFLASIAAYFSSGGADPKPDSPAISPTAGLGSVVQERLFRNFRVMFVNGCSYEEWENRAAAEKISKLFYERTGEAIKVHYTYVPITARQIVYSVRWNVDPPGGDILLNNIRKLLNRLDAKKNSVRGELTSGGRLALVLHSGAGALLNSIMKRLTSEERKKIDVISLGSAHIFKKEDFHEVMNFVAYWDPFPRLVQFSESLWPRQYPEEVLPAGSILQLPVLAHKFFRFPYQDALRHVVEKYTQAPSCVDLKA